MKIGLLSDTHSHWDDRYEQYFRDCDEIWHAGDIGDIEIAHRLQAIAPLRAVFGNIDGTDIRLSYPEVQRFICEGVDVLMKHIGGYPGKYDRSIRTTLEMHPPQLFISGHSHILKVMMDHNLHCLHINPGAAGQTGFHKKITMVRFVIDGRTFKDMEIFEMDRNRMF